MSLCTKKKDVDSHVKELLSKIKTDDERRLKGFTIARMYHHVGEHRTAQRYLSWYLQARPNAAPAHKLLGQILNACGDRAAALAAFERSLELDPHQKDLVMTGCKLFLELPATSGGDGRWLEKALKYFPNDPIVFKLKERRLGSHPSESAAEDLEQLLAAEVAAEPGDAGRHVRLVSQLAASRGAAEAFSYARRVEERRPFADSIDWYQCVADICQAYQSSGPPAATGELHELQLTALDRLVSLGLESRAPAVQVVTNLYRLDQLLYQASQALSVSSEPEQARLERRAFLSHVTGQLCYHMGCVMLSSSAQGGSGQTREAADMALALFLAAQAFPPLEPVCRLYQLSSRQDTLDEWRRSATVRLVEVGWSILASERQGRINHLLTVQQQFCNQQGRSRIHARVFGAASLSTLGRKSTSAFLTLSAFLEANPAAPRPDELAALAGPVWADLAAGSLHRAAWLRLRSAAPPSPTLAAQLPITAAAGAATAASAAPETLCRLDVLAFLEATVYTTAQIRSASGTRDPEEMFPPAVASALCTQEQADWWSAVHRLQSSRAPPRELGDLRRTLQRGLETIRCLRGHANSVRLVLRLAHWALERAVAVPPGETEAYELRAELYLEAVIPLLERLRNGANIASPKNRLFETMEAEPTADEALWLLDEASRLLAGLLLRRGRPQQALQLVRSQPSAQAAYQQGVILRQLAEESEEGDASDLLRQSLESFYLTLDRLRDPMTDAPPQLKDDLATQIREVETLMMEEAVSSSLHVNGTSSAQAELEHSLLSTARRPVAGHLSATSTPRQATPSTGRPTTGSGAPTAVSPQQHNLSSSFGQESRPSLERIFAQVLSLSSSQEVILRQLSERREDDQQLWQRRLQEMRGPLLEDLRDVLAVELRDTRQMVSDLKESQPSLERICAQVLSLSSSQEVILRQLSERREDDQQLWQRRWQEVRGPLLEDLRAALAVELRDTRQMVSDLKKAVVELQAAQQRPKPTDPAAPAQQGPPLMPWPELYGYMAAVANVRGLPLMPMGLPSPLPYPSTAYQGLPLQDPLQDSLASQSALEAALAGQPAALGSLGAPGAPAAVGRPPQPPAAAAPLPGQPAAPVAATATPAGGTPSFFKPATLASEAATSTPVKPSAPPAPANVTVSSREVLPVPGGPAVASTPPSVIVPPEHRKPAVVTPQQLAFGPKSPHQFQIKLPSSAQMNVSSPLGDSDKPAFSTVSTLPNIPAPQFSAVSPLQGRQTTSGRSPGRERLDSTGSFHEDPDYEPMADFKPIVPLPEEVEVRTGEEGDTPLFAARCKLYRFTEAEWKERGVGELRMLYRQDDGRVRIVMRRDQTHKVCANHFLQPSMELNAMKNQPRAAIWAAKDFADEELKDERLCARFKTEEIAEEFRAAFEKGKQMVTDGCGKTTKASSAPATSTAASWAAAQPKTGPTIPTVVAAAVVDDDQANDGDSDDDEYETEEETTDDDDDDEEDEEPERIACKPEFNFDSKTSGSSAAFSFGFGGGTSTASAAPAVGFKFGDKAPPATSESFGFGFGKTTTTTSTAPISSAGSNVGTSKVTSAAADSKPDIGSGFRFGQAPAAAEPKASLGGFSFSSTPTVKKPEPAPTAAASAASEQKPSPFAGFSFGLPSGGSPFAAAAEGKPLFGSNSTITFAAAAQSGPGFKKDDSFKGFEGSGAPLFSSSPSAAAAATPAGDDANTTTEEYEPNVHFEPVVPLPELVEARTGEESEEKLFGHRAKLYRMDKAAKEWKERGVGEMKIMKNTTTGKCRVLMRREQVLKLCANHIITPEMSLGPLSSSESAWVWSANDFSEGEASQETLAVKFKTVQQAQEFKEVFESCQRAAAANRSAQAAEKAATKPPAQSTQPATSKTPAKTTQPAVAKTSGPVEVAATSPAVTATSAPAARPSFVFGASAPAADGGQFHFSGVKPKSPTKPRSRDASLNESAAAGDENEYYEGDEGEHLLFEPVIPLPDKVEVKTGEEDEEVLYSHRSKLYRFDKDTGEWKERGLGNIKLLEQKQNKKIRLLMRREQVLKICLNHRLTPDLEFRMKDEKSVVWASVDYAESEPRDEVFTARFKTAEVAAEFMAAVQKAQERLAGSPSKPTSAESAPSRAAGPAESAGPAGAVQGSTPAAPSKSATPAASVFGGRSVESSPSSGFSFGSRFGSAPQPQPERDGPSASFTFRLPSAEAGSGAAGSGTQQDSDGDEVQVVGELQPTAEQRAAAARLQLPSGFYLYEQRAPCPGCRGCRDEMPGEQTAAGDTKSLSAAPTSSANATSSDAATSAAASSPFKFSAFAFGSDQSKTAQTTPKVTFGFGASSSNSSAFSFTASPAQSKPGSIFGGGGFADNKAGSVFGSSGAENKPSSIFGDAGTESKPGSIFGGSGTENRATSVFGSTGTEVKPSSIFGGSGSETKTTSIFCGTGTGNKTSIFRGGGTDSKTTSIFGNTGTDAKSIFGGSSGQGSAGSVFGSGGAQGSASPLSEPGSGTQEKSSIFGGKPPEKPSPLFGGSGGGTAGAVFGTPPSLLAGAAANGASPGSATFGSRPAPAAGEQDAADRPTFGFGLQSSGPAVDFAALAKSGTTFAKQEDPKFKFAGAGASLFQSRDTSAAGAGSDEETAGDDSAHDPHFEPLVPLPELVDVKTGEEDEQKLFCHRAILYRFNKDTSEWKERGRGDFKLLHNASAGTYRVLMRRDQVHKLACNHRVTPEMSLSRLGASPCAWVWSALDYADEEPKPETLAVKFKTEALAEEFKMAFETAIEKLKLGETTTSAAEKPEEKPEEAEEDEDEDKPMFEKRATLHVLDGAEWKTLGMGDLRVLYDADVFAVKVVVVADKTGDLLYDNLITMQHTYKVDGKTVTWTAQDCGRQPAGRRTFCAQLASTAAAAELGAAMDEGVEIASGADISDAATAGSGQAQASGAASVGLDPSVRACDPHLASVLAELLSEESDGAGVEAHPPADED